MTGYHTVEFHDPQPSFTIDGPVLARAVVDGLELPHRYIEHEAEFSDEGDLLALGMFRQTGVGSADRYFAVLVVDLASMQLLRSVQTYAMLQVDSFDRFGVHFHAALRVGQPMTPHFLRWNRRNFGPLEELES